jgi:ABC-type oligopeptide transport system substrate-binding subunit
MGTAPLQANDPERLGAYRLIGRLGEGGQGVVYLGEDEQERKVAVKLLHARFSGDTKMRARFAGELSSAKRVAPFCTAQILDADVDGEVPYLVSEFIDGPSLRGVVDREGPRSGSALQRLAIGTVTALAAIHEAGIVHRDFKPTNVLLASDGPRVIDFGIARALDATGTVSSTTVGTPSYMSPEQISAENVGPATDVFAWGCTMAYAATGAPPFGQDSIPAVMNRILHQEPGLGALSGTLREIVAGCLSKDPRRRPTTQQILLRLLSEEGVVLPSAGSGTMLGRGAQAAAEVTPTGRTIDRPQPSHGPGGHTPAPGLPRPGGDTPPPGAITGPGGDTPPPRRRRRRPGLLVGITAALVLLATAGTYGVVRVTGRAERTAAAGRVGGTFRMAASPPQHIDPSNAVLTPDYFAVESLFTGLSRILPDGSVGPALATRTTSDAGCRRWSFTIRQGTRFSDGQPVDAAAFARSWNRTARNKTGGDGFLMRDIEGYADVVSGKASAMKGVTTEGAGLLKVTLTKPDCDFGNRVAAPVFAPVPSAAGEPSDPAYDRLPIGNGPYKIRQYVPGSRLSLVRNDAYAFAKPKLDAVDISFVSDANQAVAGFDAGRYDWVELQPAAVPQARARHASDGRLIRAAIGGMAFLLPIDDSGPMASKDARLAVSYALDRTQLISAVYHGIYPPATSMVPPAIPGALAGGCAACAGDPQRAKALAAKAGLDPGSSITLSVGDSSAFAVLGDVVRARLKSVLGWDVRLRKLKPADLFKDETSAGAEGLYPLSLVTDYPAAEYFLYTLLSSDSIQSDAGGTNFSRYRSSAFDRAIDDARSTRDAAQRIQRVRAAEKIALDDMALIPLYSHTLYRLADTGAFVNVGSDYLGYPTLLTTARK